MPKSTVDAAQLRTHFSPLCTAEGVELVDARLVTDSDGAVLRVLLDVPGSEKLAPGEGGVTLDQCKRTSRALSAWLDEHESFIPGAYRLEVGSPGVERPLVQFEDFQRFSGRDVRVTLNAPVGQRKKSLTGHLLGVRDDSVILRGETGEEVLVPYAQISRAQLVFRF